MPEKSENRRIPYFGDFVLFGEIGRGGMGVVYSAHQSSLDRPVALKVLNLTPTDAAVQRLRIEAEAVARLDHPNIVPIYETGEHEGRPYLAMQLIEGESLAERIAELGQNVNEKDAAELMAKIARAVAHAHQRGVLHRDLKPANIVMDANDEPHLIDFGLAKCLEQDAGLTATGAFLGTPAFASPEQAAGQTKSVTTASDVYSLGAIFYALLTGQPPFAGESAAETIEKIKSESPRRLRSIRPSLSADLEIICLKCLEKAPARRYLSALALAEDLERHLDGRPIVARPVGAGERLWMWTRRNPVHAALGITIGLAALAAIVGVFLWRGVRAEEAEARSQILQLQLERLKPRSEGWFEQAWARANKAAKIGTLEKSRDLKNQAVAVLAGLDAHRVELFTNYGASSVVFDHEGRRLLIGGLNDRAKLWDRKTGEIQALSRTNLGPLAFANGWPVELRYDSNQRVLFLDDVGDGRVRQEWKIPERIGTIEVKTNAPKVAALAPDGTSVAAVLALADGTQALLAARSNTNIVHPVKVVPTPISYLAISSDGSLVAAAYRQGPVSVWQVDGGPLSIELLTDRKEVRCLAFKQTRRVPESPNAARDGVWMLAVGDSGGNVTVWDLLTRTVKALCQGGHYGVSALVFNPDGTTLASGGRGPVKLWDVATGRCLLDIQVGSSGEYLTGLDFVLDGRRLAISTKAGTRGARHVTIWELESERGIHTLRGLSGQISKVCFSADGNLVAALSHHWEVGVWNLASGQLNRVFEACTGILADNASLAFDPSGQRLAFAAGEEARMWHVESGAVLRKWPLRKGLTEALSFPDKNHLLLGRSEQSEEIPVADAPRKARDSFVYRIRNLLGADRLVAEDPDFNGAVENMAVSRGGQVFVVEGKKVDASEGRIIKAYDGFTGKEIWHKLSTRAVSSGTITIAAAGQFVAFQTDNTTNAVMVDLASGAPVKLLKRLPGAISQESGYYVTLAPNRELYLFKDTNSVPIVTLGLDGGNSSAQPQFDPAGNQLAWGNADGTVTVCEIEKIRTRLGSIGLGW